LIPILGLWRVVVLALCDPKGSFSVNFRGIFIIFFSLQNKVIIKKIGWLISFSDNFWRQKEWVKSIIICEQSWQHPFKYWHNWTLVLFCSKVQKGTC
jgi:hypothetical protein